MLPIIPKYITNNDCFKQGRTIKPKGIIVHSLGVPQPNPDIIFNTFNQSSVTKAVHAIVSPDKIYQIMPWNYRSWGCGSGINGSGNNSYIQFEICEPGNFRYAIGSTMIGYSAKKNQGYFDAIWTNSVDLCVYLCNTYNINPEAIICHSEAHKKGIASNHGDVMHWFPKHGKTMDDFRKAVKDKMSYVPTGNITPESNKTDIKWLQEKLNKANKDFKIKVDGVFKTKTRVALLLYWDKKGWSKESDLGWLAGKGTIEALCKL